MNWTELFPTKSTGNWQALGFSEDFETVIVGEYFGLFYISRDYCQTWTAINLNDNQNCWQGAAVSTNGKNIGIISWGGGLYISNDYGQNWTKKLSDDAWQTIDISDDGSVFLAGTTNGTLVYSIDEGNTWNNVYLGNSSTIRWNRVCVGSNGSLFACGEKSIYFSRDYGNSWAEISRTNPIQTITLQPDGRNLIVLERKIYELDLELSTEIELTPSGDTEKYWYELLIAPQTGDAVAISVDGDVVLGRSNFLQDAWTDITPETDIKDWRVLALSYDGRKVIVGSWGGKLLLGEREN